MLIRSDIALIKYWFSVSDEEQERRFEDRIKDPTKRWKLSPMDIESRARWIDYSRAKDEMFKYTDTKESPWRVVQADDKKKGEIKLYSRSSFINTVQNYQSKKYNFARQTSRCWV